MIKVHKKGEQISVPIKYDFKYKVRTPKGFFNYEEKQVLDFNGNLKKIVFSSGKTIRKTPDHVAEIIDESGSLKEVKAELLKVGDKVKSISGDVETITSISEEPYSGKVYDFTVPTHQFYANDILTHNCCRLRLDTKGMDAFNARMSAGGVGGAGEKTGSIGVVTISLPKVGYLAKDEDDLFARLGKLMDIAAASLAIKRKVITQELKTGLYPYTKRYLGGFQNHFSTIGFVGLNELCVNFMQKDLTTPEGNAFGKKVLEYMKERKNQYSEKYKQLFNLEATPAESTAYRLAKHNKAQYPELFTQGTEETPYYTNSMWLPVNSDIIENDVWKAIELEEPLQCVVDGGTVMHVFLGEQITDWRKTKDFVFKVFNSSKMPYITMSPKYSVCKHGHGYISGDTNGVCPMCKKEQLEAYKQELAKLDELEKELK